MMALSLLLPASVVGLTNEAGSETLLEVSTVLEISAPALIDYGAGLPGDSPAATDFVVKITTNAPGYELSVLASDLTGAAEEIGAAQLTFGADATGANGGTGSTSTAIVNASTALPLGAKNSRSQAVGDDYLINTDITLPFVASGIYNGTAIFSATANGPAPEPVDLAYTMQPATFGMNMWGGSGPLSLTIDGDDETYASPNGDNNAGIRYDFGVPITVSAYRVKQGNPAYAYNTSAQSYVLESSDNASSWTVRATDGGLASIDTGELASPVTARYWRIRITQHSGPWGWDVYSFSLYDIAP